MGDEEDTGKPRVLQMVRAEGADKSCVTFVLHNEDHTLGNSLRYMIMKEDRVPLLLRCAGAAGTPRQMDHICFEPLPFNQAQKISKCFMCRACKNPEVEFCGYSITHPSESKINFRIQTKGGLSALEVFQKGLEELTDVCQHVLSKFEASMEAYKAQKDVNME